MESRQEFLEQIEARVTFGRLRLLEQPFDGVMGELDARTEREVPIRFRHC